MNTMAETKLEELASKQAGCVSRCQAVDAGFSDDTIAHRVRSGRWRRAHRGVYTLASVPSSWWQDVWVAVLGAGRRNLVVRDVAVSHETALLAQGIDQSRLPRYPITLTVPHHRHRRVSGAVVHQIDDLTLQHLVTVDGLPVTRPARAIVDLAANHGPVHLGSLLDELIVARQVTLADVSACLTEVARPGKPGIARVAHVLDERGPGHVPSQSELETRLFAALAAAGLPEPVRQFALPGQHPGDEFVDAAYLDAMILLEADGRRWHSRIQDLKRDRARDAEASLAGWLPLRFTYEQIVAAPHDVGATVKAVRAVRLAQLGRAAA